MNRYKQFTLLIALFAPATTLASFPDVLSSHPNHDAIVYVQSQNIVSGYPDGTFRPDNTINRAELTKIIILNKDSQGIIDFCGNGTYIGSPDRSNLFSDVQDITWYTSYVCRAKETRVIKGYPDGTFRPGQNINFVETAKIIVNATTSIYPSDDSEPWYQVYVSYLSDRDAVPSSISSYDKSITRGEVAEILYRLYVNKIEETNFKKESNVQILNRDVCRYETARGTYNNADLGFCFKYDKNWDEPVLKDQGFEYGDIGTSNWKLVVGPKCDGCAEGTDIVPFRINGYPENADIANKVYSYEFNNVKSDNTQGTTRVIEYEEGGMCGSRKALIIHEGSEQLILTARCPAVSQELAPQFDVILNSIEWSSKEAAGSADNRDSHRNSHTSQIRSGIRMYSIDYNGELPATIPIGAPKEICFETNCGNEYVNLNKLIELMYITHAFKDPLHNERKGSGYFITKENDGSISVSAPLAETRDIIISY